MIRITDILEGEHNKLVAEVLFLAIRSMNDGRLQEALNPVTGGMTVWDAKEQTDNLEAFVKDRSLLTHVELMQVNHDIQEGQTETLSFYIKPMKYYGDHADTYPGKFWLDMDFSTFLFYCTVHMEEAKRRITK